MQSKVKKLSFKGQNIYCGIDVHHKNWVITIIVKGTLYKTFSQDPSPESLALFLEKNFPDGNYFSVYEAGFCGFSVHRELEKNGIKNIIVNPADIPTTDKDRRQKEDKRDSRKLARGLYNNELTGIYIMSIEAEGLRSLVRHRKTIVKELVRHKNRIKALLKAQGIKVPKELNMASKYWSAPFIKWLKGLKMPTNFGSMVLQDIIDTAEYLRMKLLKINREFRKLHKESPYSTHLNLLRGVPGIGSIAALTILSELETLERFENLDKLCSYVGLIPSTNSSGENERTGNITRRSNKPLRSILIESAWVAIKYDPALYYSFNKLKQRMNPNKAIIRIAKKILNRIRFVLKNEKEYVNSTI